MKKISEMTPGEALTEQALAVFKRRLEQARKKAVESAAATKAVFDARKSNLPKWRYEFDCRKCDNIREVHDPRKGRDGDYCIPCIEHMDSRRPSPIHADEKERVLRCECFTPIPEDEEEEK